ncbi:MAG: DUF937 domain-containing protein [Flavobacteriales bacterium]|nr:DUF937 domain-containing protein [Flavobacteriales bacterium]
MSKLGQGGLDAMAEKIGATPQQTSTALEGIVPTLLGAMSNNAKSEGGASGLLGALDRDHDGSILDDITGFIGNSDSGPGAGILKHVLGNNQTSVENGLSAKTGLSSGQIGNLLKIAAPLLMGYLGRQKRQAGSGGFDISSVAGLLGGLASTSDKSTGLDLSDILNMVGGLTGGGSTNQSSGGGLLGGLLGKLFKR